MAIERRERKNIVVGSLWMIGITLLFFWLPAINGVIGGIVGGYKVGNVGRALAAAVLPAIVVALGLWILLAVFDLGVFGFFAGVALGLMILLADVGLFIGAAIGGALRQSSGGRRRITA